MSTAFVILLSLIIIASILLIAVVLLQNGKDGGLATNFTSANQTLGVRQTATILEKATWYLVAFILLVSILTVFVNRGSTATGTNDAIGSGIVKCRRGSCYRRLPRHPAEPRGRIIRLSASALLLLVRTGREVFS